MIMDTDGGFWAADHHATGNRSGYPVASGHREALAGLSVAALRYGWFKYGKCWISRWKMVI